MTLLKILLLTVVPVIGLCLLFVYFPILVLFLVPLALVLLVGGIAASFASEDEKQPTVNCCEHHWDAWRKKK